jgi:hypothetical protein
VSAAARIERTGSGALLFSPRFLTAAAQESLAEMERTDISAMLLIQQRGWPEPVDGERWLDTRPMLDEREVGLRLVDQARVALAHALQRQLVEQHPVRAHLVRAARRSA